MDNKKKVILIAIIILIILMIIISIIMIFNKKKSTMNQYMYVEEIENKNIQKVDNYSQFFSVSNCITLYYTYIGQKDEGVYQLLDTEYVQENNITNTNVLDKIEKVSSENIYYNAEEMYTQDNKKLKIYYVHGKLKEDMFEEKSVDTYFIVYVDNYNTTFAIYPITQSEYNTCIQNGKEIHIEEIAKNDKNKYTSIIVNDETITTRLLYDYKDKVQNDIEASYEKLEENYRKTKFENIEEYKNYIGNRNIEFSMLSQYLKTKEPDYTQYVCVDQNGNYYIFRETSAMNYTVILDTYTIDLPEFLEKYNTASDQQKVALNIDRFMQAINDKDYKYAYNCLADSFKNNYFKTQAEFESYVKKNFYENSDIKYNEFKTQQDLYTYSVIFTDKKTGEKKNKTFVMQLGEGTKFVLSFNR